MRVKGRENSRVADEFAMRDGKEELARSERLAFTGRIAASIAHEIRNPLSNVSMSVQQLRDAFAKDSRWAKHIDVIIRNTSRINFLITELLNCARPPKLNIQLHDIHAALESVLSSVRSDSSLRRTEIVKNFDYIASTIRIDREQIERVFSNLIINAVEAIGRRGRITIMTGRVGEYLRVKIEDTGKGISEEDIFRIFDPFFSTKSSGIGLGLSLCYGIIVSHGGTIEVESTLHEGATFSVFLPIK